MCFFVSFLKVCRRHQACVPVHTEVDQVLTANGIIDLVYIKRCGCAPTKKRTTQPSSTQCQLSESRQTFFAGTKYEKTINVGVCTGRCDANRGETDVFVTKPLSLSVIYRELNQVDACAHRYRSVRHCACVALTSLNYRWRSCAKGL